MAAVGVVAVVTFVLIAVAAVSIAQSTKEFRDVRGQRMIAVAENVASTPLVRDRYGDPFARVLGTARVWINGDEPAHGRETVLGAGDEIAVLPPVIRMTPEAEQGVPSFFENIP